jgi:serine/threonine kinase 38
LRRLGTGHVDDIKSHAFFQGVDWETLYLRRAAYQPVVEDELDTQNFESFDEDTNMTPATAGSSRRKKACCGLKNPYLNSEITPNSRLN